MAALVALALAEDLGAGDRTSEATVPERARARGRLLAKQDLVVCGLPLLPPVFERLGPVACELLAAEGDRARPGDLLATVDGGARTLLAGERLLLNLIQHLCGIATLTRQYVERVAGTPLVVRDTRKTLPGMRVLAKYAVRLGGGSASWLHATSKPSPISTAARRMWTRRYRRGSGRSNRHTPVVQRTGARRAAPA